MKMSFFSFFPFSNISVNRSLNFRKKCHDMLLYMVLGWKIYHRKSWRQFHVFMKKGLGRFMPYNSLKVEVQLAVLSLVLITLLIRMGCIICQLRLQWLLGCLLTPRMVLGSTATGMWMVVLDRGSVTRVGNITPRQLYTILKWKGHLPVSSFAC